MIISRVKPIRKGKLSEEKSKEVLNKYLRTFTPGETVYAVIPVTIDTPCNTCMGTKHVTVLGNSREVKRRECPDCKGKGVIYKKSYQIVEDTVSEVRVIFSQSGNPSNIDYEIVGVYLTNKYVVGISNIFKSLENAEIRRQELYERDKVSF